MAIRPNWYKKVRISCFAHNMWKDQHEKALYLAQIAGIKAPSISLKQ